MQQLCQQGCVKTAGILALTLSASLVVSGCGITHDATVQPVIAGAAVHGTVFGGEQPVGSATLQIYAVGSANYGSPSSPLVKNTVTTDANGNFSLTGAYTCPSASTLVYLTATGGNPGLAAGTNNTAISEIALLGACGNLTPNTFVTVNELSTIAAVYAMQPFITSTAAIGAPSSNQLGILAGFTTASSLVSLAGHTPGIAPSIATIPSATLNSLADAISSCINSDGNLSIYSPCGRLFSAATPASGIEPTDTVSALIDIARNPSHNAIAIFNTITSNPPYQPALTSPPSDWSIAINYAAPAFHTPADIAVDSQGQVWVLSSPGTATTGSSTVSVFTLAGLRSTYAQTAANFGNFAIDPFDNVWLTNTNASNVVELSNSGVRVNFNPFTGGGLQGPGPIAFDPAGDAWIVNNSASISELSPAGAPLTPANGYPTGAGGAVAIALDSVGQVWTADSTGNGVTKLTNTGLTIAGSPYTNGGLASPFAIAIDSTNEAFVANRTSSTLTKFASSGNPPATSTYTGGGLTVPVALAVDGANNAWAVNAGANTISQLPVAISGQGGYGSAFLTNPYKLAIDNAGNIWVANVGTGTAGSGVITQMVGIAAPVVTPLSVAVKSAKIGQRP